MSSRAPARTTSRRTFGALVVAGLLVVAAVLAAVGEQRLTSSSSVVASPIELRRGEQPGALGEAGGAVPDGTTVFDDGVPAVANLAPALLGSLRRAAVAAARDGVELRVNSGWRSPAYQEHLLEDAIAAYGSREEAARWVATPQTSAHVSGAAVDVGPSDAAVWLSDHGAAFGLCRIYRNEPWHFERRAGAIAHGCPAAYADPTRDPRMHR